MRRGGGGGDRPSGGRPGAFRAPGSSSSAEPLWRRQRAPARGTWIRMRTGIVMLTAVAALLAAGPAHSARHSYGVSDDWPEWTRAATGAGGRQRPTSGSRACGSPSGWDATALAIILFQAGVQAAVDCAQPAGIRPLTLYPGDRRRPRSARDPARRLRVVRRGSSGRRSAGRRLHHRERPNANRFWQPQYRSGVDAAAVDASTCRGRRRRARDRAPTARVRAGDLVRGNDNPGRRPTRATRRSGSGPG